MTDIHSLAAAIADGRKTGADLAEMVQKNQLSKSDRRKIMKLAKKPAKANPADISTLSDRQKLRLVVKEKKKLPKLSSEERRQKYLEAMRDKQSSKFTICLGCRQRGHLLKDCKVSKLAMVTNEGSSSSATGEGTGGITGGGQGHWGQNNGYRVISQDLCFNCGSLEHMLRNCPQPRSRGGSSSNSLPFAHCFVCGGTGHIARDCPSNEHGLYPNGGCCHICGGKTHLSRDCPQNSKNKNNNNDGNSSLPVLQSRPIGKDGQSMINDDVVDLDDDYSNSVKNHAQHLQLQQQRQQQSDEQEEKDHRTIDGKDRKRSSGSGSGKKSGKGSKRG